MPALALPSCEPPPSGSTPQANNSELATNATRLRPAPASNIFLGMRLKGGRTPLIEVALLASLCWGCAAEQPPRETFANEGRLCLRLKNDGTLVVRVQFPTCLSSSCDRVVETRCEVMVSGTTLDVTSHGTSEATGSSICTADCGALVAECQASEALEPGEYVLHHGADSASLTPGNIETCVFGNGVP